MLPSAHRLRDGATFRQTVRSGRRAGRRTVVVHVATTAGSCSRQAVSPARVGLVVGKAVGDAVVRNRVKRRLRHLARAHVDELPASSVVVVRALPAAATASYAELGADLAQALGRAAGTHGAAEHREGRR